MSATVPAHGVTAEQRIAEALARIERAAAGLQARNGQLEQATRTALADLDRLIARVGGHG